MLATSYSITKQYLLQQPQKNVKYLEINLTKYLPYLCTLRLQTFMRENWRLTKWRDIHGSWITRLNPVVMLMFPKLKFRVNPISLKILTDPFCINGQALSKMATEKVNDLNEPILKHNTFGAGNYYESPVHKKAAAVLTVWHRRKDAQVNGPEWKSRPM